MGNKQKLNWERICSRNRASLYCPYNRGYYEAGFSSSGIRGQL